MISLNSVIKFLSENNKNKKINDYDSIPKFELKKDAMKILESIESKNIEPIYLYLAFQNKTAVGIKANAANDDWKFGLPSVPITPFVFESHFKKSNPKL
jgi:hypothetical protein